MYTEKKNMSMENSLLLRDSLLINYLSEKPTFTSDYTKTNSIFLNKNYLLDSDAELGKEARAHTSIQINHPNFIKILVVDIDTSCIKALKQAKQLNCVPNFIVKNRDNERGHLLYLLQDGIKLQNSTAKTKVHKFYEVLRKKLTAALGGDIHYVHLYCKNPWNDNFIVEAYNTIPYIAKELSESLPELSREYKAKAFVAKNLEYVQVGERNQNLFTVTRIAAASLKKIYPTEEELYPQVEEIATTGNLQFKNPLPFNEVKQLAESVTKYVINHNVSGVKNIGAAEIDPNLDLSVKQSKAAYYSHAVRTKNTLAKLKKNYKDYKKHDSPITVYGFSKFADVSYNTVKKYWDILIGSSSIKELEKKDESKPIFFIESTKADEGSKTYTKIVDGIKLYLMKNMGELPSKSSLAKEIGITRKTIAKYWKQAFDELDLECRN